MKAKEFLFEAKRPKIVMPKQRDPNWRTMQAKATSGAGGTHKDQKRAVKQGNVKHKKDLIPMEDQGVAEAVDPGRRRILAGMLGLAAQGIVPRSVASALTQELSAASVADDALERAALSLLNAIRWRLKQFEDDDYEDDGYGDEVGKIAGKLGMSPDQFEELMELYEYGSDPDDAAKQLLRHLENVDPRTITVSDRDFDDYDDDDDVVNPAAISKVANQAQTAATTAASFRNLVQRMISKGNDVAAPPREKYMGRIEPTGSALALPAPDKTAAEIIRDLQDIIDRTLTDDEKEVVRQEIRTAQNKGVAEGSYTTEKQILTRIRQIMYDRKLSGTESNAGELNRLKQQLKDIRSQQSVSEGEDELYGLRIGDTVTTKINGQTVQGDVIDLFPDDMEVELSLRGPETGKTVVVDVRDTEYFESQDLTVREEETRKSIPELEKEMETYQAILKKSQEITKSIKYDNIPSEIITEIKMLADQFNIPEEMFKDAIDEIFDARSKLESAVYGLEEPITDRIREIKHAILELEDEEYYKESSMADHKCPSCGGPMVAESMLSEKKDACYYKVKSRYKVWPSAYASGALVQCRKKGAKNWGKG